MDAGAWHQRAIMFRDLGRHQEAIADESKAIEIDPQRDDAYAGRGLSRVELEDWDAAERDFLHAIELDPAYSGILPYESLLLLARGSNEQHRLLSERILREFDPASDVTMAGWALWTCTLLPDAFANSTDANTYAKEVVARASEHERGRHLRTLGAVLYRAGQTQAALDTLMHSEQRQQQIPDHLASPASTWYFLAMAHQQAAHMDEARMWLDKADDWTHMALQQHEDGTRALAWENRITLQLLQAEARELLGLLSDPTSTAD